MDNTQLPLVYKYQVDNKTVDSLPGNADTCVAPCKVYDGSGLSVAE